MKLLDKVGDALLTRLVPGIEARANCGTCRYSHLDTSRCPSCRDENCNKYFMRVFMDNCGRVCARKCSWNKADICGFC
jgi:hypothetical protein